MITKITTPHKIVLSSLLILGLLILITPADKPAYKQVTPQASPGTVPAVASRRQEILFEDLTLTAGIVTPHLQGDKRLTGLDEALGSGACVLDYNGDGWQDLFIVAGSGSNRYYGRDHWWQSAHHNRLYKNLGGNRFREVSRHTGLDDSPWGMGCAAADLDNDGDTDLFLTNKGANTLYRNNGNGTFTDVTRHTGIKEESWSTSAAFADYNNDGLLDIYVVNYLQYQKGRRTFEKNQGFKREMAIEFDAALFESSANRLYRNNGNLKFTETGETAGVANKSGRGLAATWFDYNNDFLPDLFVSNDTGFPNALYQNLGDGRFEDVSESLKLVTVAATAGIDIGDINNDRHQDILLAALKGRSNIAFISQSKHDSKYPDRPAHFTDQARDALLAGERFTHFSTYDVKMADFDNDGALDVFIANGVASPDPDSPGLSLGQINALWIQSSEDPLTYSYHDTPETALRDTMSSRSAALADFDNDGDLDIYVSNNNDLGQLLVNQDTSQNYLNITLVGETSNPDGFGAKVTLNTPHGATTKEYRHAAGFLSTSSKRLHFGLKNSDTDLSLEVRWPSGKIQRHDNIEAGQHLIVHESGKLKHLKASPKLRQIQESLPLPAQLAAYHIAITDESVIPGVNILSHFRSLPPDDQIQLIEAVKNRKSILGMRLLIGALEVRSTNVRSAAIEALRVYESPLSMRWLLHSLSDPDKTVRCKTANAFEFFFREDEAIPRRKHLAIPALIRQLDDPDPAARICAIKALGESENYRPVQPLIKLLQSDDIAVLNQSVRALGMLRETEAAADLLELYRHQRTTPSTRAHILVALRRLEHDQTDALFAQLTDLSHATSERQAANLQTMASLVGLPQDSVVFKPSRIAGTAQRWLIRLLDDKRERASGPALVAALKAFLATKTTLAESLLDSLLAHPDESVKALTYVLKIRQSKTPGIVAHQALTSESKTIRQRTLDTLVETKHSPALSLIEPHIQSDEIAPVLIDLLAVDQQNKVDFLKRTASDATLSDAVRTASLQKLSDIKHHNIDIDNLDFHGINQKHNGIDSKLLDIKSNHASAIKSKSIPSFLHFKTIDTPSIKNKKLDIIYSNDYQWASDYLKTVALDSGNPDDIRRKALNYLAQQDTENARRYIIQIASESRPPLLHHAINMLSKHMDKVAVERISDIAENKRYSDATRLIAIHALLPYKTSYALKLYRQHFSFQP